MCALSFLYLSIIIAFASITLIGCIAVWCLMTDWEIATVLIIISYLIIYISLIILWVL